MNRKAFALALAVVFVFAFASSAFAAWGDSGYIPNPTGQNPHGPYDTTTKKCAVCHAVHNADPNGVRLLPGGTGNACVICHIATTAGYKIVYKGQQSAFLTESERAHNNPCEDCHTVHGSGTVNGGISGVFNLRGIQQYSAATPRPASTFSAYSVGTDTGTGYNLSQWCSGCHPYYNTNLNGPTHVMRAATNNYPTGGGPMRVAWTGSAACADCHNSTTASTLTTGTPSGGDSYVISDKNFPHYTDGARFLMTIDDTVTPAAEPVNPGDAGLDGVCLRCHINSDGTEGVGRTF